MSAQILSFEDAYNFFRRGRPQRVRDTKKITGISSDEFLLRSWFTKLTGDNSPKDRNDCKDQQDVDHPSGDVQDEKSDNPQNQK